MANGKWWLLSWSHSTEGSLPQQGGGWSFTSMASYYIRLVGKYLVRGFHSTRAAMGF